MGVNISDIVPKEHRSLADFKEKWIAIDAYNTLYQFLSIIRQPDGTPLKDSKGRTTSHLAGLLYRTTNLLEAGINPVFVFDGKPHELKSDTIAGRRVIKEKARNEWEKALKEGDLEKARSKAQQTSQLTTEMVESSWELLGYLGVPCVQSPKDGEAQASYMAACGDVWAAASQDFDSLLFGAPTLIRNLTITGKRKLPRRREYVNVEPEEVKLEDALNSLTLTREQLVDLAILVGTDFNPGIKGIGPKKALKLLKQHKDLENVMEKKALSIENYQEIRNIFLKPEVTDDYEISLGEIQEQVIEALLVDEHDFSVQRVKSALDKVKSERKQKEQRKLDQWF
ncbi:MAG: flap endonuclease-1 [Methanomassiliicoccales archaeon]|nr:MAG: flap endonuclease-1 [Methanomassiliicoccales archaeon]